MIKFKRPSFVGQVLAGETLDRMLLLGDLCDLAYGEEIGQWVRLAIRMHRNKLLPDHIALALDDIEQAALESLNV
jgi:hypothetical protein